MVAHEGHETSSTTDSMAGMSGTDTSMHIMQSVFFASTNTPLYSASWTPQNAGQYAGTCIFLIVLAITLRACFMAKSFLEARAMASALKRRYVVVAGEKTINDQAMNDGSSTSGILTTNGVQEDVRIVSAPAMHNQPWRFSVDLPRALLMTVAAAVGYLLMLAIMTYNIGYFLSVLAGVFIGEVAFGRFNHAAMSM